MAWMRTAVAFNRSRTVLPRRAERARQTFRIELLVRPVQAADAGPMQAFVGALDAASRRWRFHGAVSECSPDLLSRLTQADRPGHVAFVACLGDAIVGEARYVVGHDGAEFAIAVADAFQGHGVAGALMQALVDAASAAGVRRLYGDVMEGNSRMAAFMSRHGFEMDVDLWRDDRSGVIRWQRATTMSRRTRARAMLIDGGWLAWSALSRFAGRHSVSN